MNDTVILHIGERRFLVTPEEAMQVCSLLCASSRLSKEWISRDNGSAWLITEPDVQAACITPFTAVLQLECDANRKLKENKS